MDLVDELKVSRDKLIEICEIDKIFEKEIDKRIYDRLINVWADEVEEINRLIDKIYSDCF